jgi:hypothetical protein
MVWLAVAARENRADILRCAIGSLDARPFPRRNLAMTDDQPVPPGVPGHSRGLASLRRQPVRIDNDGMNREGWTELWEVMCPACGDRADLDYADAPPKIQRIRGPYDDREAAMTALELHIGLNTPRTRAAGEFGL